MKVKFLAAVPFLAMSVLASQMAHAVDTTLTLSGQILPVACTLDFDANGVYDFGDRYASALAVTGVTAIQAINQNYSVTCSGPTRIAFKMTDNRSATSVVPANVSGFGLGQDQAGNNIGYSQYNWGNVAPIIDGSQASYIYSADTGSTWGPSSNTSRLSPFGLYHSFAATSTFDPFALTTLTGTIQALPIINDKSTLDLTRVVNLDGSATMEIIYL